MNITDIDPEIVALTNKIVKLLEDKHYFCSEDDLEYIQFYVDFHFCEPMALAERIATEIGGATYKEILEIL